MARTQEMAEKSYEVAKQVHNREFNRAKGINILNKQYGMTRSSASKYINGIIGMLNGQMYKWQMRENHTEYFLKMIEKEFGFERLKRALLAVKEHIKFYSKRKSCNVKELYNSFMQKLGEEDRSEERRVKMAHFDFNPFGNRSLVLKFECDECKHKVTSEEIDIPEPNYCADTASDSQTDNDEYAVCNNCEKEFHIVIYSTYGGGNGYIENLQEDESCRIEVIEYPEFYYEEQYEAILSNNLFFYTFTKEMDNLKKLNEIKLDDDSLEKTLKRQLFVGIITSMETYLSDAFINTALGSEDFIESFVKTFKEFKKESITLNKLFEYHEKIKTICKRSMLDITYHNLPRIKGIYKDTLEVDLGNIGTLCKAVLNRHDLVHRNGKTKEGIDVDINSDTINNLISETESFISNIDKQIKQKANRSVEPHC